MYLIRNMLVLVKCLWFKSAGKRDIALSMQTFSFA